MLRERAEIETVYAMALWDWSSSYHQKLDKEPPLEHPDVTSFIKNLLVEGHATASRHDRIASQLRVASGPLSSLQAFIKRELPVPGVHRLPVKTPPPPPHKDQTNTKFDQAIADYNCTIKQCLSDIGRALRSKQEEDGVLAFLSEKEELFHDIRELRDAERANPKVLQELLQIESKLQLARPRYQAALSRRKSAYCRAKHRMQISLREVEQLRHDVSSWEKARLALVCAEFERAFDIVCSNLGVKCVDSKAHGDGASGDDCASSTRSESLTPLQGDGYVAHGDSTAAVAARKSPVKTGARRAGDFDSKSMSSARASSVSPRLDDLGDDWLRSASRVSSRPRTSVERSSCDAADAISSYHTPDSSLYDNGNRSHFPDVNCNQNQTLSGSQASNTTYDDIKHEVTSSTTAGRDMNEYVVEAKEKPEPELIVEEWAQNALVSFASSVNSLQCGGDQQVPFFRKEHANLVTHRISTKLRPRNWLNSVYGSTQAIKASLRNRERFDHGAASSGGGSGSSSYVSPSKKKHSPMKRGRKSDPAKYVSTAAAEKPTGKRHTRSVPEPVSLCTKSENDLHELVNKTTDGHKPPAVNSVDATGKRHSASTQLVSVTQRRRDW